MRSRKSLRCVPGKNVGAMRKGLDRCGDDAQSAYAARFCDGEELDGPCGAKARIANQAQLPGLELSSWKTENVTSLSGNVLDPSARTQQLLGGFFIREPIDPDVFQGVRPDFELTPKVVNFLRIHDRSLRGTRHIKSPWEAIQLQQLRDAEIERVSVIPTRGY